MYAWIEFNVMRVFNMCICMDEFICICKCLCVYAWIKLYVNASIICVYAWISYLYMRVFICVYAWIEFICICKCL